MKSSHLKNKIASTILLLAIIMSLIPAMPVSAQSELVEVEIQPSGANMKDTFIVQQVATNNYGNLGAFTVGEQSSASWTARSLLEFDLSGLPRDPIMESASLFLTVATDYSDNARTMYVYALDQEWSETTSSWNNRMTATAWDEAGAFGEDDVLPDPIGSVALPNDLEPGDQVEIVFTDLEAVREMIKQNYFGFLLKMDVESDDQYDFYSSDEATEAYRPMLILEYYPSDEETVDPGWFCYEGGSIWSQSFPECLPDPPGNSVSFSPFEKAGVGAGQMVYGSGEASQPMTAAKLNCEPYPRCINDYPIYYRITYVGSWTAAGSTSGTLSAQLDIPGGTDVTNTVACGAGTSDDCFGVFEGVILPSSLPIDHDGGWNIGLLWRWNFPATWTVTPSINWTLHLSLQPFDQGCFDTYYVPEPETFEIDPTLEEPVGDPTDEQIYETVIDEIYMARVVNTWNDGTDDRADAAVSLDGETWMTWAEFSAQALCITYYPETYGELDYQVLFFIATTETFHIRVNDEEDEFGDNTTDELTPAIYSYVIGQAFLISESDCDSSFSYTPEMDLLVSLELSSTSNGTLANSSEEDWMQPGEWYAIEVESGTWNEPASEDRTDMEYIFASLYEDWEDLAEGSELVWCEGANVIYIQAPAEIISLRVNDQDSNFANNSGSLDVNIYHTTYTFNPVGCAEPFATDDIVASGMARGDQVNGVAFGNNFLTVGLALSYAMVPGAWYVLETRDGPWWLRESFSSVEGDYQPGNNYYDVQLKTEVPSSSSEWVEPEEWTLTTCVVEIDPLGHIRVYFQVPDNNGGDLNQGGAEYFIRVAGAGFLGMGDMGWDLYQAIDVPTVGEGEENNPWNTCYNQYVNSSSVPLNDNAWIPVKEVNGTSIIQYGATGGGASVLTPDKDYWLETKNGPWYDGVDTQHKYSAQLSSDGGSTWFSLSEHPDVFCSEIDPLGSYEKAFFHVEVGEVWKIRVADTETEIFTDNTGTLAYTLHAVNPVGFPVTTDDITDYNFEVCAPILIRPYIPGTIFTSPSMDAPETPSSWDVEDWVTYLGEWFGSLGVYVGELFELAVNNLGVFFGGLGRYAGDWVTYINRSFTSYFAWCPRHVNIILTTINRLKDKEPIATIMEIKETGDTAWAEVQSYDWGTAGEGGGEGDGPEYISIFSFGEGGGEGDNTNVVDYIFERFFPMTGPGVNIWSGDGDIVVFGSAELPTYYYTCNDVFGDFLPERLRQGVCFTSAHWRGTGAWWWIQLSIDISAAFLVFTMIKSSAQELIYMMTGVKPWVKDNARGMEKLVEHLERAEKTSSGSTTPLIGRGRGPRAG